MFKNVFTVLQLSWIWNHLKKISLILKVNNNYRKIFIQNLFLHTHITYIIVLFLADLKTDITMS